ncbi:hypothetical protein MJO29_012699 [Puccinia striiformis f. sp. tritici]|nr:hypothetical protein MJO29_012699 [Puccinia striiformis f. sp. tritici]
MPWIQKHGHLIDWSRRCFASSLQIAAAAPASSYPTKASLDGIEPVRHARILNEGVCADSTSTLPQCKLDSLPTKSIAETAGKLVSFEKQISASREEGTPPYKETPTATTNHFVQPVDSLVDRRLLAIEAAANDEGTEVAARSELTLTMDPTAKGGQSQSTSSIATALTVSSTPKKASLVGMEPVRHARLNDEGVCALSTLALPQCEFDSLPTKSITETAGKLVSFEKPDRSVDVDAAKASWSTSARLTASSKAKDQPQALEELVPKRFHGYLNMFRKIGAQRLPPHRKYDFRVELIPGAQPQTSRIIPLSPAENQALETLVNEGLEHGTIRRTTSPWAAPVLFTGKKDDNLRPCFDYRKLNAVTVKNKYPLPLTMDLVDSLLDADQFTKLDLRNAYGNLRVAEGDEEKLAFICRAGQFAPLTMPFGPTGAPGYFQYFMQDILLGRIGKDAAVYLDDIMIYTQKGHDHEGAVDSILETLSKHHLWLKPEKCEFSRTEVEYLGLLISCNRIRMDPGKVKAVTEWPAPTNVTELQRFIGFANFYRRFIDHFSSTTRPLHNLIRDKVPFVWDEQCDAAFEGLKLAFTTAPVLKIANPYQPFILECDCSDFALGAVLSQVCVKDDALHPVAYLSRSLIQAERNYEIFDKELLAIVASFKEWCHYLEGNPNRLTAVVYTDHRNLESFMTTKQLTRRQARWAETMGCFDFEIIFRPGRQSAKPDALSRRPDLAPNKEDKLTFGQLLRPENITSETFAAVSEFETWFENEMIELDEADHWFEVDILGVEETDWVEQEDETREEVQTDDELISRIRTAIPNDVRLRELMQACQNPVSSAIREATQHYSVADGVLYNRGRIEVPSDDSIKTSILRSRHDSRLAGHPGRSPSSNLTSTSEQRPEAHTLLPSPDSRP